MALILLGLVLLLSTVLDAVPVDDHPNPDDLPEGHAMDALAFGVRRPDYTYTEGIGAYKLITNGTKWNTARQICNDDGAHLVIINSDVEAKAVIRLLNSFDSTSTHVGVHNFYQEGEFVTILDELLARTEYNVWREGEPNNLRGEEHCVAMYTDGKLNDIPCYHQYSFVCELPCMQLCL